MANDLSPSPEDRLALGDPGDETANRYRFQWTWAAVVCCMLLDENQDVQEVFCEHHEDVLIKHWDGSFTGQQIKTRGDNQLPWKAGDEAVLEACVRFAKLESEFPGKFRCFSFLSNHQLFSGGNSQDLQHVLKTIKDAVSVDALPSKITPWFRKIVTKAKVQPQVVFEALSKTKASGSLPKLNDAFMRLMNTLNDCWSQAGKCTIDAVRQAGQGLIEECARASSVDHLQLLPGYLVATVNSDADKQALINGKRMTLARVESVLEQSRDSAALLVGDPSLLVNPIEGSPQLLLQKLEAGGFSYISINSAVDLCQKADFLGIKWRYKHGRQKGLERYSHIRSLVLSDASRAFEATQTPSDGFGPAMRDDLRRRFRERRTANEELFDTTDDHLEGFAFSLTAQCVVHWSNDKPWESS